MSLHQEIALEDSICTHLAAHGWLYDPTAAARYDRTRALFPEDLFAWVRDTQSQAWDSLAKTHGGAAETMLLDRLRDTLNKQGALHVLRNGVDIVGLRQPIALCQFRPTFGSNAELTTRYA